MRSIHLISLPSDPSSATHCSVKHAAKISGYAPAYIWRLVRDKKVDAVKIAKTILVDISALMAYVNRTTDEEDARYGPRREPTIESEAQS